METILEEANFKFTQESNCVSQNDIEEIEIKFLSDMGIDRADGGFFVLKTEQWSIDSVDELEILFERIKKIMIKK